MNNNLQKIPAIGGLLNHPDIKDLVERFGREVVTYSLRKSIADARVEISKKRSPIDINTIILQVSSRVQTIFYPSLKRVINATGVILHTNLGRAPLGKKLVEDIAPVITGYSNLEFDLSKGRRGQRNEHVAELLRFLTGAEDILVVNNNAAGIILVLHTFANRREVIISRGELIEIGDSFRIPEIMKAGSAKMVEVGTTNKTRISDYEKALSSKTALIFKAHKSNYTIKGFTEEVSVEKLAEFAHLKGLMFVYDIGSGLLRKPQRLSIKDEPDVQSAVCKGADLVFFSCDKLLGGPQAGIIAGKKELISRLSKAPLMRALRVGKLTMTALGCACRHYLREDILVKNNPSFAILEQRSETVLNRAKKLHDELKQYGVVSQVTKGIVQCGGGTLPDMEMESAAIMLISPNKNSRKKSSFSERVYHILMDMGTPVIGILREGALVFELHTVFEEDISCMAKTISDAVRRAEYKNHNNIFNC